MILGKVTNSNEQVNDQEKQKFLLKYFLFKNGLQIKGELIIRSGKASP